MSQPRRNETVPWVVAAIAGVLLVALLAVYFFGVRPDEGKVPGALTTEERLVMTTAATEAANVLSYRRDHFEQDFQRALSGATGGLSSDLNSTKTTTQQTMNAGKFDMSATVTHTALEGPVGSGTHRGYTVLVTLNGYRSNAPNNPTPSQLAVTVERVKDRWLVSDIESIGVTG
jgi:hypothetical protein